MTDSYAVTIQEGNPLVPANPAKDLHTSIVITRGPEAATASKVAEACYFAMLGAGFASSNIVEAFRSVSTEFDSRNGGPHD